MPSSACTHIDLHSFPTRRSSDLRHRVSHLRARRRMLQLQGISGSRRVPPPQQGRGKRAGDGRGRRRPAGAGYLRVFSAAATIGFARSEEHTSELQSLRHLVCRLLRAPTSTYTLSLHDALPIFVIEFPTFEQGVACFNSREYQEAAAFRRRNKAGENELVMVEAGEGQPVQAT